MNLVADAVLCNVPADYTVIEANRQKIVYCSIDITANNFIPTVRIDFRPSLKCFSGGKL